MPSHRQDRAVSDAATADSTVQLSVIVPAYNQASSIGENLRTILRRASDGLSGEVELILVSDGSIDRTEERALEGAEPAIRVIHYDRNLGKGYAVKIGALEARGAWIAYCDADLDLDPAALPLFVAAAEQERLDFAIGSKRHPESDVFYPVSRRVASWLYQQLIRLLFRLDVRDTQVGLKVFRREVADQVLPYLLVKRYAFDLELLAVARAFGFERIREFPIRLEYRFSGSGVRSRAVVRALADTAAIFYRLRVLRYYQRRRAIVGTYGWTRVRMYNPRVCVIAPGTATAARLNFDDLEVVRPRAPTPEAYRSAAVGTTCEVLALLQPGAVPASNWLTATIPFLARPEIAAVVTPAVASLEGTVRQRAAAATRESRLGGGSQYFRFTPGNIRFVRDFATRNVVVRRDAFLALPEETRVEHACELLSESAFVVYTPETVVVTPTAPLFVPHLKEIAAYGFARGGATRRVGFRAVRPSTAVVAGFAAAAVGACALVVRGGSATPALVVGGAYVAGVAAASGIAGLRFRSGRVGLAAAAAFPLTHAAYLGAFLAGAARRR